MPERDTPPPAYVVCGNRSWSRRVFEEEIRHLPGAWHFIGDPGALTAEALAARNPRYVFFLHWSHLVPETITAHYECVCFHMTDVPYGRGGTPLQNLIARGHRTTRLTALRMTGELDAGPVYGKETLALDGTAEEIYLRANRLAARMIARLIREHPAPVPQTGEPTVFRRRRPEESALPAEGELAGLYDHIRMLDAEGYPHAFLRHGAFRLAFRGARLEGDRLTATVTIRKEPAE